jgi:hypothetical protein
VARNIPIFAHCNRTGMRAGPNFGAYSHPNFWKKVLEMESGKYKTLRLCLAHAGGGEGWIAEKDDIFEGSLAYLVYQLCITYENVYCEFGYLDEILNSPQNDAEKNINAFKTRLKKLLAISDTAYFFKEKIMYGSDYHMLYQELGHEAFLDSFNKIFEDNALKTYKNAFFSQNAIRYLNF